MCNHYIWRGPSLCIDVAPHSIQENCQSVSLSILSQPPSAKYITNPPLRLQSPRPCFATHSHQHVPLVSGTHAQQNSSPNTGNSLYRPTTTSSWTRHRVLVWRRQPTGLVRKRPCSTFTAWSDRISESSPYGIMAAVTSTGVVEIGPRPSSSLLSDPTNTPT